MNLNDFVLVTLCQLVGRKGRSAAGTVGHHPVAFVHEPFFEYCGKGPPCRFDVGVFVSGVRLFHIQPVTHPFAHFLPLDVTLYRTELGAKQNRLEFTINSLSLSSENLQDAESRVRNADMAREMMDFTLMNILFQASITMLAKANQLPYNVLDLLRG